MMAFFQNSYYDSRTFGDGTRYFEATIDVPTPEQEARRKDDPGRDRSRWSRR